MGDENCVLALDTPTLLACAKIPATTLNYWVKRGFCTPDIDAGRGKRATRYWTVRDLVVIRAIKSLRSAGCSLQNVSKVEEQLTSRWDTDLSTSVLYYDGYDVMISDEMTAASVLREAGQGIFTETLTVLTVPLRPWITEGERLAKLVNIDEVRDRRNAIWAARNTA